jgi:2-polyprenyl-3-methyl-5-hydroxy-6-metoxy-1,4-benzoquinol methylase
MENDMEKIICPLCNNSTHHFTQKDGFDLYKCNSCKFIFVYPVPKSIEVYDDSYFSGADKGFGYIDYDADKEPMIPTFLKYLDIFSSLGKKSGRLLDIGAATGFFMSIARNKGFDVAGVEISDFAGGVGRKKGLNIKTGDLASAAFPSEYFDVVTMFDVLEHVPSPKDFLSESKRILKNGGLLAINTPDAQSFWAKLLGSKWQLIVPPEHLNYFSPKNLASYLEKEGFKVIVNTKIGKKFTLQYIFKMLPKFIKFVSNILPQKLLSKIYIPINLHDNFFIVLEKI